MNELSNWFRGAAVCLALLVQPAELVANEKAAPTSPEVNVRFPTVPAEHRHARMLLENAMSLVAPENKMIDPSSGYPFEGWNHDPKEGLYLRSFTQLTAIALWMELLANVVAGYADTPHISREQALANLTLLVKTLRQDQLDPKLSADGLLCNFLDLVDGKRRGPLISEVDKNWFIDVLGREKGEAVWHGLEVKGWITPRPNNLEAAVHRGPKYGFDYFDGPLQSFKDPDTKQKVLAILDQRVVLAVFGDNANLSISAAKTIGALMLPEVSGIPAVAEIRRELEQFLEEQKVGYQRLYDPESGLFFFGRDATKDRLFGWEDLSGKWKAGHMDYLVNEFRGPATFTALRYGIPIDAIANLGFKIKSYRTQDGRALDTLAPWDGSAFQALGLNLSLLELESPSWRRVLENVVDIEIDFSTRKKLPGFLSESYTGEGSRYTGDVGIPEITVAPTPRITDSASLYTIGTAYTVAPEKVESFLAANWPKISILRTEHGPWEGYNITRQEPIHFQTSAHTLSLVLGMLGTGPAHLKRYLDSRGLGDELAKLFQPGHAADFLAEPTRAFAWTDKDNTIQTTRSAASFDVRGGAARQFFIAFVPTADKGVNLSGGLLRLRYRSTAPAEASLITLKPIVPVNHSAGMIPIDIFTQFADTKGEEAEINITLPAIPSLWAIKELVVTYNQGMNPLPIDFRVTHLSVTPLAP